MSSRHRMFVPFERENLDVEEIEIEYTLSPADPEVGIMGEDVDEMTCIDPPELHDTITDEEWEDIAEYILDQQDNFDPEAE